MADNDDKTLPPTQFQFREAAQSCARRTIRPGVTKSYDLLPKSSAQVETLVSPPKSGVLSHDGNTKKRPNPLTIRLSSDQKALIRNKAKTAGLSINEYIKASTLGSEYRPPLNPELNSTLLKLNRELTRQGTNLNQIARQFNARVISPDQADTLIAMIARSLLWVHRAVREALAHGRQVP